MIYLKKDELCQWIMYSFYVNSNELITFPYFIIIDKVWEFFMPEDKISPELNIALETPEDDREKSLDLNVGYDEQLDEWELIVRFVGSLDEIREELNISIEELLGGFAIIRIPRYLIDRLSEYPQILYIEKPKSLILEQMEGIGSSCINRLRLPDYNLTGRGVLTACIDSGVDFYHRDFRNADGTTRIVTMWDQTIPGNPPEGFQTGSVYSEEEINEALALEGNMEESRKIVPQFDATGHGTAVLGIMAGNGLSSIERIVGVATESDIIVVKLGNTDGKGFPRTTQLMLALDYSMRFAIEIGKPLAINISFGNNYGAHTGDSMLERYMDTIANLYKVLIATGTGNDGITARHTAGRLSPYEPETVEIVAGEYLTSFNLQIYKHYADEFDIVIEAPDGRSIGILSAYSRVQEYVLPRDIISVYYSDPTPFSPQQEIYISWIPVETYVTAGIWKLHFIPRNITSGDYNMWLPVAGSTSSEVSFANPVLFNTLVVPSTARYVMSVAAYDSRFDTYAAFSGRGAEHTEMMSVYAKPDLAAPGVAINTCRAGGGYGLFSGTSFAAPFVTGAAALLLQYGIVDGNDPYLYGEKLRASLIRGARRLPFQEKVPSALVGYGALCVADSIL